MNKKLKGKKKKKKKEHSIIKSITNRASYKYKLQVHNQLSY